LSFHVISVASIFLSPAWRNWQTRWTQNPVIARSCGFEPLRRQAIQNCLVRGETDHRPRADFAAARGKTTAEHMYISHFILV
jgi:hypothetical protein